jgi:hypothetical protein
MPVKTPFLRHCEERSDEAIQGVSRNRPGLPRGFAARKDEVWGNTR